MFSTYRFVETAWIVNLLLWRMRCVISPSFWLLVCGLDTAVFAGLAVGGSRRPETGVAWVAVGDTHGRRPVGPQSEPSFDWKEIPVVVFVLGADLRVRIMTGIHAGGFLFARGTTLVFFAHKLIENKTANTFHLNFKVSDFFFFFTDFFFWRGQGSFLACSFKKLQHSVPLKKKWIFPILQLALIWRAAL